jgi:hypothetical protein
MVEMICAITPSAAKITPSSTRHCLYVDSSSRSWASACAALRNSSKVSRTIRFVDNMRSRRSVIVRTASLSAALAPARGRISRCTSSRMHLMSRHLTSMSDCKLSKYARSCIRVTTADWSRILGPGAKFVIAMGTVLTRTTVPATNEVAATTMRASTIATPAAGARLAGNT